VYIQLDIYIGLDPDDASGQAHKPDIY